MHRVELKVSIYLRGSEAKTVPNAPCGVERHFFWEGLFFLSIVPNAPCGVERLRLKTIMFGILPFLMHRVELKE